MLLKNAAFVMVVLGGLMGCAAESSSGGSNDEQGAVSALSEALQKQQGPLQSLPPLDATQADCVASGLVDATGTEALVQHGILNSDLTVSTPDAPLAVPKEPATQMVNVITECVDLVQMQRQAMLGTQEPPGVEKCFEKVLDDAGVRRGLLGAFTGDQTVQRDMNKALRKCIAMSYDMG